MGIFTEFPDFKFEKGKIFRTAALWYVDTMFSGFDTLVYIFQATSETGCNYNSMCCRCY